MTFDLATLRAAVAQHGPVARIVVAAIQGSTPREVGASMLVWETGQSGTIGGGALELQATQRARVALGTGDRLDRIPLGPELGQCCGGAMTLATEVWDSARLDTVGDPVVRPLPGAPAEPPLSVRRHLAALRNGSASTTQLTGGWLIEPVTAPATPLWLWGAGHVGRAIADVLAPLPGWEITWIDTAPARFPDRIPEGVSPLVAADPPAAVRHAPPDAHHLILTYSHEIDLALCHALLAHGFGWAGLIGSDTKWARFRSRLRQLGHNDAAISGICCPIGRKSWGKHPQAIAVGVAAELLSQSEAKSAGKARPAGDPRGTTTGDMTG